MSFNIFFGLIYRVFPWIFSDESIENTLCFKFTETLSWFIYSTALSLHSYKSAEWINRYNNSREVSGSRFAADP